VPKKQATVKISIAYLIIEFFFFVYYY